MEEKRFVSAHMLQYIITGKSRLQELEAASHIMPKVKSRVMNAYTLSAQLAFSTLAQSGVQNQGIVLCSLPS